MTEADTCRKLITPKLQAAGWESEPHSIAEQRTFTDGRIIVHGNKAVRRKGKRADYILRYTRDFPIAVVEAKPEDEPAATGLQQSKDYAEILKLNFAYATNGATIIEFDYITGLGRIDWDSVPFCECTEPNKYLLRGDDLLFARTGATTGKTHLVRDPESAVFASYLIRLRPKPGVLAGYLHAFFQSDNYWTQISGEKDGSAQPNVNGEKLASLRIPLVETKLQHAIAQFLRSVRRRQDGEKVELPELPLPLAEQRRVVTRIEELAAQIHDARTLRHQAAEEAEAFVLSALKHLRLPRGTVDKPISACSTMSTGTTPPSDRSDYYGGPIQWYTPGDLEYQQQLGASSRTLSEVALAERKARMFEPGTVLLVAIGGSLGKVALTHERCSANQQITGIKFSDEVLPEYGFWWMRRLGKDLMAAAPQATLPIINQERIGVFEISVPPLPEQRRIVSELDALQAEVDALKRLQAETATELDALLPAILDRAFKGHL